MSVNRRAFACLIGQKSSSLFYDLRQALVYMYIYWIISDLLSHYIYSWRQSSRNIIFFSLHSRCSAEFFVFIFFNTKFGQAQKYNKAMRFFPWFWLANFYCVWVVFLFLYFIMKIKNNRNLFTLNRFKNIFLRSRRITWQREVRNKIKTFFSFWQSRDWFFCSYLGSF